MPTWLTIFLALGGSTLIALIVTTTWHFFENKAKKIKDRETELKELKKQELDDKRHQEWHDEVKQIIQPVADDIKEIKQDLKLDKEATTVNIRVTMKSIHDRCCSQGYADDWDKLNWSELYQKYKEMGGNHFVEIVNRWKAEMEALPLTPTELTKAKTILVEDK